MRLIATADVHLSGFAQDRLDKISGLPERLESIKKVMYQMTNYARNNDIKQVFILGDLFHNKSIIYSEALGLFLRFLRDNKDLTFTIFSGNHDLSSRGTNPTSALEALSSESNVIYIKEPTKIDNDQIFIVPYSEKSMISDIKNNSCKYLMSHFGLSEALLNSGISIVSGIGISDLKNKYKYVFLGHYHSPQNLSSDGIEIYYTGNLLQSDWGEKNEIKRFLVIDTVTDQIQSIPTSGYKKHIELELTNENKEEVIKQAEQYKLNGDEVKLLKSSLFDIDDVPADLRIIDKTTRDITNRGITSGMTMDEKISKYLEIRGISTEKTEMYKKVGIEIISSISGG
jgi:DNA repair exonuclease SbcCD nuclease subunit